jgi:hypothetical protein
MVVVLAYIPTSSVWGFLFSPILTKHLLLVVLLIFFFFYCRSGWGYTVAFTKVLTMYQICHTWIHPLPWWCSWPLTVGGILVWFWFAFPLWQRLVNTFLMDFLAIWASSFEKALFSSFAHFHIRSLIWEGSLVFWAPFILVIHPLCDVYLAKICSHSVCGWLLQFRNHFFCCA